MNKNKNWDVKTFAHTLSTNISHYTFISYMQFKAICRPLINCLCPRSLMDKPSQLIAFMAASISSKISQSQTSTNLAGRSAYRLSQAWVLVCSVALLLGTYLLCQTALLPAAQAALCVLAVYHTLALFDESKSIEQKKTAQDHLSLTLFLFTLSIFIALSFAVPALSPVLLTASIVFVGKLGLEQTTHVFQRHSQSKQPSQTSGAHKARSSNTKIMRKKRKAS